MGVIEKHCTRNTPRSPETGRRAVIVLGSSTAPEFHIIREMHYRNEFKSVDCLQDTANRFFVDQQSRKAAGPAVSGGGAAIAASSSDQCHRCKEFKHFQRDCPKSAQPSRPTKG